MQVLMSVLNLKLPSASLKVSYVCCVEDTAAFQTSNLSRSCFYRGQTTEPQPHVATLCPLRNINVCGNWIFILANDHRSMWIGNIFKILCPQHGQIKKKKIKQANKQYVKQISAAIQSIKALMCVIWTFLTS